MTAVSTVPATPAVEIPAAEPHVHPASRLRTILDSVAAEDGSLPPLNDELVRAMRLPDDLPAQLGISDVAEITGITAHTLRYYERIGLVEVARDAGGHRSYSPEAVRRLVFLTRMRLSGMAMRDLQHYVRLADEGEGTVPERLDLLLEHRDTIRRQLRELTLSLAATEYKIATYGGHTGP